MSSWDDIEGDMLPDEQRERGRPEARLEREFLRALGREFPSVLAMKNEVGVGYRGALKGALERALRDDPRALAVVREVMQRHRLTYGLGVGSPDLPLVVDGWFLGAELKTETGRLSPDQERWHDAAREKGADIIVVRTVEEGLEAVRRRVR